MIIIIIIINCSQMHSKVSSDWLPSYIIATQLVLEIFKMAGHFPDSPCIIIICLFLIKPYCISDIV